LLSNPSDEHRRAALGHAQSGLVSNQFSIAGNPTLSSCEVSTLRPRSRCKPRTTSAGKLRLRHLLRSQLQPWRGTTAGQSGTFTGDAQVLNAADLAWLKNVVNLTVPCTSTRQA